MTAAAAPHIPENGAANGRGRAAPAPSLAPYPYLVLWGGPFIAILVDLKLHKVVGSAVRHDSGLWAIRDRWNHLTGRTCADVLYALAASAGLPMGRHADLRRALQLYPPPESARGAIER